MIFSTVLFYILAFVAVVAAARVVLSRSPVVAALHLMLTFFTASMLWILIGAEYLGLLLVIIYVGAVMVMFLFVVMMIDIVPESLRRGFRAYLPLGLVVGGVMVLEIASVLGAVYFGTGAPIPVSLPASYNNVVELGNAMYSEYSYAIQVGALVLLVGMIAAVGITLRERKNRKYTKVSDQLKANPKERVRLVSIASGFEEQKVAATEIQEGESK
ncbi:MAG: NADH-quinone oxidoreductase subunit J [Alcaligenaceae bacterium]|nr:NADH-quinone oxidoreductase subunit J [Alcaligenaceae bacterium]